MDFQDVVMRLNAYWAEQGCLVWHPYNVQLGAGTGNPATALRVLGPEPWNVAYLEPSVRPDDGRYGENPNRWQQFYQYQVILKPDPGNPQELYLKSLEALGIDTSKHDVRFVEDNWESPALGAWGLGWEVWLDGQEISQYTYFQQAGGQVLDPVAVELTYGLERIVMVLQGVRGFNDIRWRGDVTYGEIHLRGEVEHCTYNFEVADIDNLYVMYDACEVEAKNALVRGLAIPAHDYVAKCSHIFNVLDTRGAIGVTERAQYFVRMRDLTRAVSTLFVQQREEMGYPLLKEENKIDTPKPLPAPTQPDGDGPFELLFEIGSEELPVSDLDLSRALLEENLIKALQEMRLGYADLKVLATPRRSVALVQGLAARQIDQEQEFRGPSVDIAYDDEGNPTRAATGFARGRGVDVADLQQRDMGGKDYVVAVVKEEGRSASEVLAEALPELVASIRFPKNMRWNASSVNYSRPLRWFVALLDDQVIPFEYAGVQSGRVTRGIRPQGSPELVVESASAYMDIMAKAGVILSTEGREQMVLDQAHRLAEQVGGVAGGDDALIREVANLGEYPLAILGQFEPEYLRLPDNVLLAVMRKHQRYLPLLKDGKLLPYFVAIANGSTLDVDLVRFGNEDVLRARYADGSFFYDADRRKKLEEFTPRLATLTFQEKLGSVLDKTKRLEKMVPILGEYLGYDEDDHAVAARAASLCKSDLATQLVVELTSLQGQMGRHYAELDGERPEVALAIEEHYFPRFVGDRLPEGSAGVLVGLADRLDTLVGLFAVGIRPSGAADPWGMRRAALGLVQLLVGKKLSLSLSDLIAEAASLLPVETDKSAQTDVLEYVMRRFRVYMLDRGFKYDLVDAALGGRGGDLYLTYRSLEALVPWAERDDWAALLDSYARCVRITRDLEKTYAVDETIFVEAATADLYAVLVPLQQSVSENPTVDTLMAALVQLQPSITMFFDNVLVMAPEANLKENRLGLLQAVSALPQGILDLSVVEGF